MYEIRVSLIRGELHELVMRHESSGVAHKWDEVHVPPAYDADLEEAHQIGGLVIEKEMRWRLVEEALIDKVAGQT